MTKTLFVIPKGTTLEEIKERKKIIRDFYAIWNAANPTKQVCVCCTTHIFLRISQQNKFILIYPSFLESIDKIE